MTHNELLAKIDNVGHSVEYGHGIETSRIVKQLSALRAVVELHKPEQVYDNLNRIYKLYCYHCDTYDNPTFYPCLTIQAIEKELK